MCLYPKLIKNRKYTDNKKNGGNIPTVKDERLRFVPIACQNCIECRKKKAREWQVRLLEDIKTNTNGKYITLTFSNEWIKKIINGYENEKGQWIDGIKNLEGYNLDNEIATRATRLFLERWRKKYTVSIRHWLVTELGGNGTENIHLHGIVWTNIPLTILEEIWKYGYVWKGKYDYRKKNLINYVNETTVGYITKYVHKIDEKHKGYRSKILTSPGIGHNYTRTSDSNRNAYNNIQPSQTKEVYRTKTGHKISLPIYWRNKIYSEEEREKLWLNKLDKQERWIRGERVDISKGHEQYWKLLKWHQELNKELGYGDDIKNWEKHEYETQLRNLKIKERIKSATRKHHEHNNKY